MIQVGVVGYGYAGRCFHSYLIRQARGLNLYAVVSSRPEGRAQAERECSVVTYESLDQLLDDDKVQLVVIATPHDSHAPLSLRAMDGGKHVVTDKVMCLNASECESMIAAANRNGIMLSVFHNRRWDGDYLTVRKVIEQGLLGEPFLYESSVLSFGRRRTRWRDLARVSGGLLYDWGAHLLDQALQLVPSSVESVFCDVQYGRTSEADAGDHARVALRFSNRVLFHVEVSKAARLNKPRWWILGTRGALLKEGLDPQEAAMVAGNIDTAREDPAQRARLRTELDDTAVEMTIESVPGSWKSYYQNVSDHLNDGEELAVTPDQMLRLMRIYDAARESSESGGSVQVNL